MAISVSLPLSIDDVSGFYSSTFTPRDMARNNLLMVLYTNPGERVWDIDFGVGIERYLFENNTPSTLESLRSRILEQVSTFLPYLNLLNVNFETDRINPNKILIRLDYEVAGVVDVIELGFRLGEPE